MHVEGRSSHIDGRYTLNIVNAYGRASAPIYIRWKEDRKYFRLKSLFSYIYLLFFLQKSTMEVMVSNMYNLSPLIISLLSKFLGGGSHDGSRSYVDVRFQARDEQSHQIGQDIYLQCTVHGSVEQPYEYVFTKDGQQLENSKIASICFHKKI